MLNVALKVNKHSQLSLCSLTIYGFVLVIIKTDNTDLIGAIASEKVLMKTKSSSLYLQKSWCL